MRFSNTLLLTLASVMSAKAAEILSCTVPNTIAWTFDDGPYQYTNELLDTLKANNIKVTFFINAQNWWTDLPTDPAKKGIIKRICDEGHQVASHSWNHWQDPSRPGESIEPATLELTKQTLDPLDDLIQEQCGYRPKYFRAPKGEIKPETVQFAETLGYKVIKWDTDTNDWNTTYVNEEGKGYDDPERRVKDAQEFLTAEFAQKRPNYLILDHDTKEHTVKQIVPWVIQNKPEGYQFVTVAECLGDAPEGTANRGMIAANTTLDQQPSLLNANNATVNTTQPTGTDKDGAETVVSNIYIISALLLSTIYMLF